MRERRERRDNVFTIFAKEWWEQFTAWAFSPDDEAIGLFNALLIMIMTLGLAMYGLSLAPEMETATYVFRWWHIPAGLAAMCVLAVIEMVIASAISSVFVAVAETIRWLRRDKRGY